MSTISSDAEGRREGARRSDGRFGRQEAQEAPGGTSALHAPGLERPLSLNWDLDPATTVREMRTVASLPESAWTDVVTKNVAGIRRRLRNPNIGWQPDEDRPITVLVCADGNEKLIDGNNRVEALRTAGGYLDLEIECLVTTTCPVKHTVSYCYTCGGSHAPVNVRV